MNYIPPSCRSGGMADATDSKSVTFRGVRVQVPPPVPLTYRVLPLPSISEKPEFLFRQGNPLRAQHQLLTLETAEARRLILSGGDSLAIFISSR